MSLINSIFPFTSNSRTSLTEFAAEIRKGGLTKPNRFEVGFGVPESMFKLLRGEFEGETSPTVPNLDIRATYKDLRMYCTGAVLPGKNLASSEIRRGSVAQPVYGENVTTADFTFYLDREYTAKLFFDLWQESIIDPERKSVRSFYDEYTEDIVVRQLDDTGAVVYAVLLRNAYPSIVSDISMDSSSRDTAQTLSVTMNFESWIRLPEETEEYTENRFLQNVERARNFVQTFQSLRRGVGRLIDRI